MDNKVRKAIRTNRWLALPVSYPCFDHMTPWVCMSHCGHGRAMEAEGWEICFVPDVYCDRDEGFTSCGDYVLCPECYHRLVREEKKCRS